jgi:hypothetical protein
MSMRQPEGTITAALVGASGVRLELVGSRYEFPEDEHGPDADWVEGSVSLTRPDAAPLVVGVTWRTEEVAHFAEDLRTILEGAASIAELVHLEEMFGAAVRANEVLEMTGFVGNRDGDPVEFEDELGREALAAAADAFEALAAAFPVRSSINADSEDGAARQMTLWARMRRNWFGTG